MIIRDHLLEFAVGLTIRRMPKKRCGLALLSLTPAVDVIA